jgi:hypothetical protein
MVWSTVADVFDRCRAESIDLVRSPEMGGSELLGKLLRRADPIEADEFV